MNLTDSNNKELKEKILKGLDLTFKKLVKAKRPTGGVFVFSKNGIIKKVKAEDVEN